MVQVQPLYLKNDVKIKSGMIHIFERFQNWRWIMDQSRICSVVINYYL